MTGQEILIVGKDAGYTAQNARTFDDAGHGMAQEVCFNKALAHIQPS
jgi:hypothetical protein